MNKSATTKTISFRVPLANADQIERAARAKANGDVTAYLLGILAPWAASDLGEAVPPRPAPAPPPKRSPVSQAAAALGIPRDKFRQLAAERVAADMLAQLAEKSAKAPAVKPTTAVAKPSGFYRRAG